jgi:hypothetical protein
MMIGEALRCCSATFTSPRKLKQKGGGCWCQMDNQRETSVEQQRRYTLVDEGAVHALQMLR